MSAQPDPSPLELPLIDTCPKADDFEQEALSGLRRIPKAIPPKFFYDLPGSELFDRICDVEDYYVTRTELSILETHLAAIAGALEPGSVLVEFGSGASRKTRLLLEHARDLKAYVPIDISRSFLLESARRLAREFPRLDILPVCADYMQPIELPEEYRAPRSRCIGFFPGSTFGNLDPMEGVRFLKRVARILGPGAGLILGVDLLKDRQRLERAYNDSEGVTAAFNLNLLARMNRELGADFDLTGFRHHAFFNPQDQRIEMHLVSLREQEVRLAGERIRFRENETIHTENSYKYSLARLEGMARLAGWEPRRFWTDPQELFCVYSLELNAGRQTLKSAQRAAKDLVA